MRRSTPALKFLSTGGVIDIDIDIENASAGRLSGQASIGKQHENEDLYPAIHWFLQSSRF